jgi:hypothetical protein
VQRALAFWAAQRACDEVGISHLDWIAPALAAMHRGEDLPRPFDDPAAMYERLDADERAPRTRITLDGHPDLPRAPMALLATLYAVEADPLDAAVRTLTNACQVFGDDGQDVLPREAAEALRRLNAELTARHDGGPVLDPRAGVAAASNPPFAKPVPGPTRARRADRPGSEAPATSVRDRHWTGG